MKNRLVLKSGLLIAGMALMVHWAMPIAAQQAAATATSTPVTPDTASASQSNPVQLSPGVPEILKLARVPISDDIIIAFLKNSGTSYDLSVSQILYLKKEGVSERVIATMLAQSKQPAQEIAPTSPPSPPAPAPAAPQPAYSGAPRVQSVPTYQPAPTVYVPSSTVYVAPYPSATYAYYDYGYYGGYWGYPYPSGSFSIGIGGFRGGFRGGGFHGGGFRGGHR